jgi:hypothetical protein
MDILHNKPVNCLFVFSVDSCGLNKLGFDTRNRFWIFVGPLLNQLVKLIRGKLEGSESFGAVLAPKTETKGS